MTEPIYPVAHILLSRYRIKRFVDEGGMQQVFEATDLAFKRDVAVKVPKNTTAEKRFERSARMSARINHPNVAKTLDYFEEAGRPHLVEEFIGGIDLGDCLDDSFDYLDPHLAAHVIHHIAKGVAASHHADVLHRDLKPSNIMVSSDPSMKILKITDFGIAKMAEEEISDAFKEQSSITGSQTVMGALPYMAPEMVESPKKAKLPADIWAIGAILYRLVSGTPPYGTGLSAVVKITTASPPSKPFLFSRRAQFALLEEELWTIVLACLQKDPNARPKADDLVSMCSKLCYSDAPRETGTIESFAEGTGAWGKIRTDAGSMIFFHQDSFYGTKPKADSRVNVAAFPGSPYPRAFPVLPVKDRK